MSLHRRQSPFETQQQGTGTDKAETCPELGELALALVDLGVDLGPQLGRNRLGLSFAKLVPTFTETCCPLLDIGHKSADSATIAVET